MRGLEISPTPPSGFTRPDDHVERRRLARRLRAEQPDNFRPRPRRWTCVVGPRGDCDIPSPDFSGEQRTIRHRRGRG